MKFGRMIPLIDSPLIFTLLCVVAIPVTLFRLFGVLFFASTISGWAVVPAVAVGALLAVSRLPQPARGCGAIALLVSYLCSVYFHGWADLMDRLAEGRDAVFDGTEAALVALLVVQCLMPRKRWRDDGS